MAAVLFAFFLITTTLEATIEAFEYLWRVVSSYENYL